MYYHPYWHPYNWNMQMNGNGIHHMPGFFPYDYRHGYMLDPMYNMYENGRVTNRDQGGKPFVVNIEKAAEENRNFRTALWTGRHLQVTLMSIPPGEDIGLEVHRNVDQFIRIEEGQGLVQIGDRRNALNFERRVSEDDAIMIPAGKWHNVINTGRRALKLYSIYAPPEHPFGTVHRTKADAGH